MEWMLTIEHGVIGAKCFTVATTHLVPHASINPTAVCPLETEGFAATLNLKTLK
jgi:hypothetical protein